GWNPENVAAQGSWVSGADSSGLRLVIIGLPHSRQEHGEQSNQRQIRTYLINVVDASGVGDHAQYCRSYASHPECETEEQPGDHSDAPRHKFLRKHDDRGKG